jgi:catechol 2,3-dioxygenase-like lactoylglutathione lyase family enzyme
MFHRVTIRVADRAASERFYATALGAAGVERTTSDDSAAEWDDFSLTAATVERPPTRRLHIGFAVPTRDHVDAFWRAGTAAGYRDDGAPGPRPQYTPNYYGGFLLDPDGNSAEAVHHEWVRTDGNVDHLWIRVADVGASKRFYEAIAPDAGLRVGTDTPMRVSFDPDGDGGGTFSLVAGPPTEHLHIGFRASGPEASGGFHSDPDGNSVEIVR